jgi:hydrogenase nickel incorporation protein HypA/HybF
MHELSIAMSMIEMAGEEAARQGADRVAVVHLKLGQLSGVVREALEFSFHVASKGTLLENSRLEVEDVPVIVYCPACNEERAIESIQRFCCPGCGTLTPKVIQGNELLVVALELETDVGCNANC